MKGKVSFVKAQHKDIPLLKDICVRSFHSDVQVGAEEKGGPPGYDNPQEHRQMLDQAYAYLIILVDGNTAGGLVVFQKSEKHFLLGSIYLDTPYHRQGIGSKAVEALLKRYPQGNIWDLDTPLWNRRTRAFYEKLGFKENGRDEYMVYYRKEC